MSVDYFRAVCSGMFHGAEAEDETLELLNSPADICGSLNFAQFAESAGPLVRVREQELRAGGRLIGFRIAFEADVYESMDY